MAQATRAPSSHNSQPWAFRIRGPVVELYADRARALPVVDPEDRELVMSCGAALHHLRTTLAALGESPSVDLLPAPDDPDLLARVTLRERAAPSAQARRWLDAMPRRHTTRARFEDTEPSPQVVDAMLDAARREGAACALADPLHKALLAELVAEGDRVQAASKEFRRELAAWVHPNRSRLRDGMPGHAFGVGDLASMIGPFVLRTFDWGGGQAAKDRELAEGSPLLVVLGTATDDPRAWLTAGQALSAMLLEATAGGLSASYLNQPIEVAHLRARVRELLPEVPCPQLLLRLGRFTGEVRPTPRRSVEEVLLPVG